MKKQNSERAKRQNQERGIGGANKKQKVETETKANEKNVKRVLTKEEEEEKHDYYMQYGVCYAHLCPSMFQFKMEPLINESLVGMYDLVYYQSIDTDSEEIHRTARGALKISMKDWGGIPALFGLFQIDTRQTNGEKATYPETYWGEYVNCSFVELATDWSPPEEWDGFYFYRPFRDEDEEDIQPHNLDSELGRIECILDRDEGPVYGSDDLEPRRQWWEGLPERSHIDIGLSGAVLKIVAKRHALGLGECTLDEVADKRDNVEISDKMMTQYRDGSNSWVCQHLNLPAEVAFKIREYVTPPPVFYVEEGDLFLFVEERDRPEWTKALIFRKKDS